MNTTPTRRIRTPHKEQRVSTRVSAIGSVKRADTSRQLEYEDEFQNSSLSGVYITPPFDIRSLLSLYEKSNMLKQCVAAYVTNVAMYGFEVVKAHQNIEIDPAELAELQSFIDNANSEESLTAVHAKVVEDYEAVGFAFVEIIRDRRRRVSLVRHARASTVRLTPRHEAAVKVTYEVPRGGRTATVVEMRRFRRYMQIINGKAVYFKEFGDPRRLHCDSGKFDTEGERVPEEMEATELIHIRQNSEDPYGVPRWVSQLPSILGSRESEEVNLRYFEDNTVPPMMLMVAGGRLTTQSYNDLVKILSAQGLGKDRQHQAILVEAVAERDSLDDKGTPVSLKVEKLTDTRQSDALFREYDEANQAKVRSAFRLPPVAVGLSQDVTFACYDEQTETLTNHGWVTPDQWQDGMKVACYNAATGLTEFHAPESGLLVYDVEKVSMYHIQTEQQDMLVTPNHRMLFSSDKNERWDVRPIEEMSERGRVYFKTAAKYEGGTALDVFEVPPSNYRGGIAALDADVGTMPANLLLEWLGYYLADGCIHQQHGVRIGARKARKIARFSAVHEELVDCGFRVRHADEPAGEYFTTSHKGFAAWLVANAGQGSSNKRIPEFVWGLPAEQLRILFDALMFCDGTWDTRDGRTSGSYSTVSEALADDVQRLSFLLGYRAIIRQDRPGSFGTLPVYRVMLSEKSTCQAYTDRHLSRVEYTGRVYCFSVPTGVFVTRRNGKIAIQGNTANVSQFVAETQVFSVLRRVFDEVYNKRLVGHVNGLGMKTVWLQLKAPAITNPEQIVKTLTALNVMGGMTPRKAVEAASALLQIDLTNYPEKGSEDYEEWMDKPIQLSLRGESPQNTQDEQSVKDAATKTLEQDGNVANRAPEHGQE